VGALTGPSTLTGEARLSGVQRAASRGSFGGWAMDGDNWTIFVLPD
jgi:hypothetical protein